MTQPLNLAPILARLDAATEGPWQRSEDYSDVLTPEGDHIASFWKTADGELITHAPEDMTAMAAEIRRLRTELATARVQAIRDLADKADPQRPEISFFGDHGHVIGAWVRKQAEYEQRRLAAAVVAHVVADDSDTPETGYATGLCTFGEGDAPGSGCILSAGHEPANRHVVTPGDVDGDD